ncbi:MAG: hypothetical protein IJG65_04855 [Synergistaceae bacterium]|nr:hypothetical protein [Synergistaceae bacterium]
MKRFISALLLVFLLALPSFALSDAEYLRMRKSSADFARADRRLNQVWNKLRKSLPKRIFTELDKLEREWVMSGRDDAAAQLMEEGYSRMEAYTMATNDRADALPKIARNLRDELRPSAQPRTQQPPAKRAAQPDPEPDPEPEPVRQETSQPVIPEGEYQNDGGFLTVKILDASTNEAEVIVSRFKDEVHWTARGWIEGDVLELSDNNYSSCQATLTFTAGKVEVEITDTDDWNEAIAPDFVLKGTYRKLAN